MSLKNYTSSTFSIPINMPAVEGTRKTYKDPQKPMAAKQERKGGGRSPAPGVTGAAGGEAEAGRGVPGQREAGGGPDGDARTGRQPSTVQGGFTRASGLRDNPGLQVQGTGPHADQCPQEFC